MIKKIVGCADIHVPSYKGIDELKEVLERFIKRCKEIAEEVGPESMRIVVAGDIFHNKTTITNESILAVNWFFRELDKICKTIVIAGNHDLLMNNLDRVDSISPIIEIGGYDNIVYLDKVLDYKSGCYEDDDVVWCLYSTFDNFATPDIVPSKELYKGKHFIGLIHGDINGASSATNYVCDNGLDPDIFKGLEFVIAGHIHKYQIINTNGVPITYCSSLKQQNFGENVSKHGFVLWTNNDGHFSGKMNEVENKEHSFYVFSVNGAKDIELNEEHFENR